MPAWAAAEDRRSPEITQTPDLVALSWLVMVRWTGVIAEAGAVFAGWRGLGVSSPLTVPTTVIALAAASNLWLAYRVRRPPPPSLSLGGWLVSADVVALSLLLLDSGGVLNPVSIFYLVDIVLAALVLGRSWTWLVTLLSIGGYGVLFLMPSQDVRAALAMHPEIGMHIRGMWLAFAATALIVALLVARLATLVERRDRALAALRDRRARDARLVGLATLAAGAAHELSTPLGTITVAAGELERALDDRTTALREDVRLIRREVERCRRVLNDMAGRSGELAGEAPTPYPLERIGPQTLDLLGPDERARVDVRTAAQSPTVRWPMGAVTRALANLVRNGLQASAPDGRVALSAAAGPGDSIAVTVTDQGRGMSPFEQARAGEPFFTTKPEGAGMGLGLFVAMSTIDQLGGTFALSSAEGRGTTVSVTLPADVTRPVAQT
jgi:two-component system, sensor histidine kinase RegB